MAKMNWNRPNNGYEREPWQKTFEPKIKNKPKPLVRNWKIEPKMTDELRKKIQALRK